MRSLSGVGTGPLLSLILIRGSQYGVYRVSGPLRNIDNLTEFLLKTRSFGSGPLTTKGNTATLNTTGNLSGSLKSVDNQAVVILRT